jgi:phage terminase small subunit
MTMLPAQNDEIAEWSAEMSALKTDKQRAFVDALFKIPAGHGQGVKAAKAAGYEGTGDVLKVTAHRLLNNPAIRAALKAETERRYLTLGPAAVQAQEHIIRNKKHKDNYKASIALIHQIAPPEQRVSGEIRHTHEVIDHDAEAITQLRMLQSIGIAEDKLIELFGINGLARYRRMIKAEEDAKAAAAQIIDADFKVIGKEP